MVIFCVVHFRWEAVVDILTRNVDGICFSSRCNLFLNYKHGHIQTG